MNASRLLPIALLLSACAAPRSVRRNGDANAQMDGPDLVVTHYGAVGNLPRRVAGPSEENGSIPFACVGGKRHDRARDTRMHRAVITLEKRSPEERPRFDLVREPPP